MNSLFHKYPGALEDKLNNFEKYVRRQSLSRFLARYELFRKAMPVKGCIVECGVHHGGGLMGWAKLSAALEPYALHRKIIGFDTFSGFPHVDPADRGVQDNAEVRPGGFGVAYDVKAELEELIGDFDENRYLNQFPKVELVAGDACQTIPRYVEQNRHLVVSLLFLDFDLLEPTRVALEHFVPRMPGGSVIAFDEINNASWPGETEAVMNYFKTLNGLNLQTFEFDPNIAFAVI